MVKKITAFTLVEVMMAMIIMAVVGAATMPIISKAKPRIEQTTVRGQYGCWQQGGQLCEAYYDERSLRKVNCGISKCQFRLDQRPAQFYIIATGAGSNSRHGQTVTSYSTTKSNNLDIVIGRKDINKATTIKSDKNENIEEITAKNAVEPTELGGKLLNTIDPDNVVIDFCRLISAGQDCKNTGVKQESCLVKDVKESGVEESIAHVVIEGCDEYNENGDSTNTNYIPLSNCTLSGSANEDTNTTHYNCDGYDVNFEFKNSSKEMQNASINVAEDSYSPFAKYVNMTSMVRRTDMIKCFSESASGREYPNGGYKICNETCNFKNGPGAKGGANGAVLILW